MVAHVQWVHRVANEELIHISFHVGWIHSVAQVQ